MTNDTTQPTEGTADDTPPNISLDITLIPADGAEGRLQTVVYGGGRRSVTITARAEDDATLGIQVISSMGAAGTELAELLDFLSWARELLEREGVAATLEAARVADDGLATATDDPGASRLGAPKTGYESSTSVLGPGPGRGNVHTDEAQR